MGTPVKRIRSEAKYISNNGTSLAKGREAREGVFQTLGFCPRSSWLCCPCPTSCLPHGASCHGGFSQPPGKHQECVFRFPSAASVFSRDMHRPQSPSPEFLRALKGCYGNFSVFLQLLVICFTSSAQSHPPHLIPDSACSQGEHGCTHTPYSLSGFLTSD